MPKSCYFIACLFATTVSNGQHLSSKAILKNDTLTIENSKIKRQFLWNNGQLKSIALLNKITHETIVGTSIDSDGDFFIPGIANAANDAKLSVYNVEETNATYGYLAAEITVKLGSIWLKKVFRIYDDCPALVCDFYLKGQANNWAGINADKPELKNIEDEVSKKEAAGKTFITDKITITGQQWTAKSVEFFDASDYNNTYLQEYQRLVYRQENRLRGNILLLQNKLTNAGFFLLKEAPTSNTQLYYQGFDFTTIFGQIKVAGLGLTPNDLKENEWLKGYSVVVGINEFAGENGLLSSLKNYQQYQRKFLPGRDEMIVSNTWGDRNKDTRVNEAFILKELEAGEKLGITHIQIDDGWQVGVSSNSAKKNGTLTNIWNNPLYWNVDSVKFPHGLNYIIKKATEKNIKVSLWFNPSTDSSFANWQKDAAVLIGFYKQFGIDMIKIDGVNITDKKGEVNFIKMLDTAMAACDNKVLFNLDITAGKRLGINTSYKYGSLYVENRYTDWTNYYPYTTLRNLWQLSHYNNPQRFQIEFLNKWRNADKYPKGDILAPSFYSFDYLFAITMVAQPLAFFEVSELPNEAFKTSHLINRYKKHWTQLHQGKIFPLGEEPSGFSWTGFQSVGTNTGYFIVFRENNEQAKNTINTLLPPNKKVALEAIGGNGKNFETITDSNGRITFTLPLKNSFGFYKYTLLMAK